MLYKLHLNKLLLVFGFSLLLSINVKAQAIEKYTFALPVDPMNLVKGSFYTQISLLDLRSDTVNLGIILKGAFNKKVKIVSGQPFNVQLNNILAYLIDESAKPNQLLLRLKKLGFAEESGSYNTTRYFNFQAELFAKANNKYKKIRAIDTVAIVVGGGNSLLEKGSEMLANFIAENLQTEPPADADYAYTEVVSLDSIEKNKLKLYNTDTYAEGYYATYAAFSKQLPTGDVVVDGGIVEAGNVRANDNKGVLRKLKSENVYAVVYKGKPYVNTGRDYSLIKKVNNDFFFTAKNDGTSAGGAYMLIGMQYGAVGGAIGGLASALLTTPKDRNYSARINHGSGKFTVLDKVE